MDRDRNIIEKTYRYQDIIDTEINMETDLNRGKMGNILFRIMCDIIGLDIYLCICIYTVDNDLDPKVTH